MYSIMAYFYDIFTDDIDYCKMADRIESIFKDNNSKPQIVLDLACGTGNLTCELARRGYDLIGIDNSSEMLNIAKEKANIENQNDILFLNQNMTSIDLFGTVDAVICSLDGINHLINEKSVLQCFQKANLFLNEGGLFIFDVNTLHKFKTLYSNNAFIYEKDDVFCAWQNNFNEKNNICTFDFTFFKKEKDKYIKFKDFIKEKAYEISTLTDLLEKANFQILNIYGGEKGKKPLKQDDDRALFVAKKVEN